MRPSDERERMQHARHALTVLLDGEAHSRRELFGESTSSKWEHKLLKRLMDRDLLLALGPPRSRKRVYRLLGAEAVNTLRELLADDRQLAALLWPGTYAGRFELQANFDALQSFGEQLADGNVPPDAVEPPATAEDQVSSLADIAGQVRWDFEHCRKQAHAVIISWLTSQRGYSEPEAEKVAGLMVPAEPAGSRATNDESEVVVRLDKLLDLLAAWVDALVRLEVKVDRMMDAWGLADKGGQVGDQNERSDQAAG